MITILNMSQRTNGINDRICDALEKGFAEKGVACRSVRTRELRIGVCNNCRACMKSPGNDLGICGLHDDMQGLTGALLESDGIIVSAPINCYDLPSSLRIILERMSIFCYWNDEMYSPKVRDTGRDIRGVLITTSALPGIMVPILTRVRSTFKLFAKPLRMKKVSYYHLGFKGRKTDMTINRSDLGVVRKIVNDLSGPGFAKSSSAPTAVVREGDKAS